MKLNIFWVFSILNRELIVIRLLLFSLRIFWLISLSLFSPNLHLTSSQDPNTISRSILHPRHLEFLMNMEVFFTIQIHCSVYPLHLSLSSFFIRFSSNGQPTLLSSDTAYQKSMGSHLPSFYDTALINTFYGCYGSLFPSSS